MTGPSVETLRRRRSQANPALVKLGARLRMARMERGMSARGVGALAGRQSHHVASVERGEHNPRFDLLIALAEALDVPLTWVVGDEPRVPPPTRAVPESAKFVAATRNGTRGPAKVT